MLLDFALEQIRSLRQEGKAVTLAAYNVVLSGSAERGDVDRIIKLWSELERNDLVPNTDSYSFLFESLGKNLRRKQIQNRRFNNQNQFFVDNCLATADLYLSKMEEQGLAPTQQIVRDYAELLCLAGQVDTATAIVLESFEKGEGHLVSDKTIYRVAMANANIQQFDVARQVANCRPDDEPIDFLLSKIEREEHFALGSFNGDMDKDDGQLSYSSELRHSKLAPPIPGPD